MTAQDALLIRLADALQMDVRDHDTTEDESPGAGPAVESPAEQRVSLGVDHS